MINQLSKHVMGEALRKQGINVEVFNTLQIFVNRKNAITLVLKLKTYFIGVTIKDPVFKCLRSINTYLFYL